MDKQAAKKLIAEFLIEALEDETLRERFQSRSEGELEIIVDAATELRQAITEITQPEPSAQFPVVVMEGESDEELLDFLDQHDILSQKADNG